jgi:hypothetical protein
MQARFDLIVSNAEGTDPQTTEAIDLGEFYAANDLDPEDVNAIGALAVGEEHRMGGGAAPIFAIRRAE